MFKRKKIAYYYDTDDCTYHKAGFDLKVFGKRLMSYGIVSIVLCGSFYLFYTNRIERIKEEKLRAEYQYFYDRLTAQNHILDDFDVFLNQLYEKDNEIYTSILSANKIQQSTWRVRRAPRRPQIRT